MKRTLNLKSWKRYFILVTFAFFYVTTSSALAEIEWPNSAPLVDVYGFYNDQQVFADMNFINIPDDLGAVDIYMVLKYLSSNEIYYITLDLDKLLLLNDWKQASGISLEFMPYLDNFNFVDYDIYSEIFIPGFPIQVEQISNFQEGDYVVMLTLSTAGTDQVVSNIAISIFEIPTLGPGPAPDGTSCDFDSDGYIDEDEKDQCGEYDPSPDGEYSPPPLTVRIAAI